VTGGCDANYQEAGPPLWRQPSDRESRRRRYADIHEDDQIDEAQMATWVKQAASIPGWDGT
jgi:hypothetical protein